MTMIKEKMLMLENLKTRLKAMGLYLKKEEGQTMVEYVMLIVLVALAVFLSSPTITSAIMGVFTRTSSILAT